MILVCTHNQSNISIKKKSISDLINSIFSANDILSGKLDIIITDDENLRKMKKEYFNQNLYTDVIAFHIEDDPFEAEIYISHDRVQYNAKKYKQSFQCEFKRVVIHGALHLCGFDDKSEEEKSKMRSMEDDYLLKFKDQILA